MSDRLIYEQAKRKASPAFLSAVLIHGAAEAWLGNDWQQQKR